MLHRGKVTEGVDQCHGENDSWWVGGYTATRNDWHENIVMIKTCGPLRKLLCKMLYGQLAGSF